MGSVLSPDERLLAASDIAKKDTNLAIAMSVDNPAVASKILIGGKMESPVTEAKFKEHISDKVAGAMVSGAEKGVQDAIYSYYKKRASEMMQTGDSINETIANEAIKSVLGDVALISVGGTSSRVVVPVGMTPYELQDKISRISQSKLNDSGAGGVLGGVRNTLGERMTVEDLFEGNRLVSVGNGKYSFINNATGQPVIQGNGKEFIVDVFDVKEGRKNSDSSIRNSNRVPLPDAGR